MSDGKTAVDRYMTAYNHSDVDGLRQLLDDIRDSTVPHERVLYFLTEGTIAILQGAHNEALTALNQSLELTRLEHLPKLELTVLAMLMEAYNTTAQLEEGMECATRSLHLAEDLDLTENIGGALSNLGSMYLQITDYPRALEYYHQALGVHEQSGNRRFQANTLYNIGLCYLRLEEFAKADESITRSVEILNELGHEWPAIHIGSSRAWALVGQGRADEGFGILYHALDEAVSRQLDESVAYIASGLVTLLEEAGRRPEALEVMQTYEEQIIRHPLSHAQIMVVSARDKRDSGDLKGAKAELASADEIMERLQAKNIRTSVQAEFAQIAREEGDLDAYIHHNDLHQQLKEESQGADVQRKIAVGEKEREILQERQERERERAGLYSTLPRHVADRVIRVEEVNDHFEQAAVLFTDIAGFTTHSSSMDPNNVITLLEDLYRVFDETCQKHDVVKVKTIGDSYLCFRGDGSAEENARAVANVALDMVAHQAHWPSGEPLTLRIGLHLGPVSAGVIGSERLQYDIWGDTVNTASRMESSGEPGKIQCSEAFSSSLARARDDNDTLVIPSANEEPWNGRTVERGTIDIKGKGSMTTYWLEGA